MKRRSATVPTRERILNEVERLIAMKGVHGFKLRDVADRLGLQVPAIYKHYKGRDDVLVEVSRRFITLLAAQFHPSTAQASPAALRSFLNRLVEFKMFHPAYVRLALVDFATPEGGMDYVKHVAGGPLAAMHRRLRSVLQAGARTKHFRRVDATDFYRIMKAALLIRLVFPDDKLLLRRPTAAEVRAIQRWLWNIASGFLAPRPAGGRRRS
ncbi:MAG: TetR/AcrR family transcriptional regulator [Steroidobacteraceae bacterium]